MNMKDIKTTESMIESFEIAVAEMKRTLTLLSLGKMLKGEVLALANELIENAKSLPGRENALHWGFDSPGNMPSDARVDFFYVPTYISTAMLIYAASNYPDEIQRIENFDSTLRNALYTSTLRSFEGHGYEGVGECMSIFNSVDTDKFVSDNPGFCPAFTALWNERYHKPDRANSKW